MNKFSLELEKGKSIEVELKNLAQQANGNVLVRSGDTLLLATCVMSKDPIEDRGFFPLTVDYEEKYYAAGKIKGSRFIKRESRPSDEAICNARLIDRAIRPRFDRDINREVQVITTVLSWDSENDPDVLGLVAASLSLSVSDIPWNGPIAAVRVAKINGELILNPNYKEREDAKLDIVFAAVPSEARGAKGGYLKNKESSSFAEASEDTILINMIEGGSEEVDENTILEALKFAEKPLKKLIDFQNEITKKTGKEKAVIEKPLIDADLDKEIKGFLGNKLEQALFSAFAKASADKQKEERAANLDKLKKELLLFIEEKHPEKEKYAENLFEKEIDRIIHESAIKEEKRADKRKIDEVRQIVCEVGILPRTHGSGLFSRGATKALSILTLGSPGDQQLLEGMEIEGKKAFMHHYNFPPYSVGEIRPVRGPGRREIGHGMLAEKALLPLLPGSDDFPYTIRVVSEMLSSNGSTSMASVSSSCLALMDAGVPIRSLAAGIAIGLMQDKESGKYKVLTDIQGPEDHYGDMDFKVAGTRQGITAIQMDVKIDGISEKIMKEALIKAKKARLEILDVMEKTLPKPRAKLSPYAPRIVTLQINPDKIREVIGPGGKIINEIIDKTDASIDIQDSGLIFITAEKEEAANKAVDWIKDIVREVKVGETFEGKVKRILAFGAFVEILPGQEGMIHISKLSDRRVEKVEDVVNIGDTVSVKVISIDEQGRIDLALLKNNK